MSCSCLNMMSRVLIDSVQYTPNNDYWATIRQSLQASTGLKLSQCEQFVVCRLSQSQNGVQKYWAKLQKNIKPKTNAQRFIRIFSFTKFYPRGASDARVLAIIVCLCVCVCQRRYCIKTAKHRITQTTLRYNPGTLVFWRQESLVYDPHTLWNLRSKWLIHPPPLSKTTILTNIRSYRLNCDSWRKTIT